MFEKELGKVKNSVQNMMTKFFGKEFTVGKMIQWKCDFLTKYTDLYDVDKTNFRDIKPEHREDVAKYRTLVYFMNIMDKICELEETIRSDNE